jgi:hypothetical protein
MQYLSSSIPPSDYDNIGQLYATQTSNPFERSPDLSHQDQDENNDQDSSHDRYVVHEELEKFFNPPLTTHTLAEKSLADDSESVTLLLDRYRSQVESLSEEARAWKQVAGEKETLLREKEFSLEGVVKSYREQYDTLQENHQREVSVDAHC